MSEKREIVESFQTTYATVNLRNDGISEVLFIEEYELDVPQIKEIQAAIMKIGEKHPLFILVIPGQFGDMTKEAREAPMFESNNTKSIAIVTKYIHQRILGNLYFKFKKAQFSNYKMFRNKELATAWLNEEMAKEN